MLQMSNQTLEESTEHKNNIRKTTKENDRMLFTMHFSKLFALCINEACKNMPQLIRK